MTIRGRVSMNVALLQREREKSSFSVGLQKYLFLTIHLPVLYESFVRRKKVKRRPQNKKSLLLQSSTSKCGCRLLILACFISSEDRQQIVHCPFFHKMIILLQSSEGRDVPVEKEVAIKSMLIKNMVEDLGDSLAETPIPLLNVSMHILEKVLEWCEHHKSDEPQADTDEPSIPKGKPDHPISAWDEDFLKVDQGTLFELILVGCFFFF